MIKYLFVLLILVASPIWGATYTVCTSGCDYTTLTAAVGGTASKSPDDIIEVRADSPGGTTTFNEQLTWSANAVGTQGHPITLQARAGDTVVIDGQDARDYCIDLQQNGYLTISNITLQNFVSAGIRGYNSGAYTNNYINLNYITISGGGQRGMLFLGGDHINITYPYIENITTTDANQYGDGMYFGTTGSLIGTTNLVIDHPVFTGTFGRGALVFTAIDTVDLKNFTFTPTATGLNFVVDIEPNDNQICKNISIHDGVFDYTLADTTPLGSTGGSSETRTVSTIDLYNVLFDLHGLGDVISLGFRNASGDSHIYNNRLLSSGSAGFSIYGVAGMTIYMHDNAIINTPTGGSTSLAIQAGTTAYVYDNIIMGALACAAGATCYANNNSLINYIHAGLHSFGTMIAHDNVCMTDSSDVNYSDLYDETGSTSTYDYNLYYSPNRIYNKYRWGGHAYDTLTAYKTASGQDANSITADPLFSPGSYYLQFTSPAKAASSTGSYIGAFGVQPSLTGAMTGVCQ